MDFLETVYRTKDAAADVEVHLVTCEDELLSDQQEESFFQIQTNVMRCGIKFTWEYVGIMQTRHIETDHGWKILLDRGLDIFQPFDNKDMFSFVSRIQGLRLCRNFKVIYMKK